MSPLEFARRDCANYWNADNTCIGVPANALINISRATTTLQPLNSCLLADGQRCDYFEKVMLPQSKYGKPEVLDACKKYRDQHPDIIARGGGICACGKPKATTRTKYCEACKQKRKRVSNRDSMRKSRAS